MLRCKTPDLARKEISGGAPLVYHLIRGAMAEAVRRHDVMPREISLQGARQTLKAFREELNRVPTRAALALTESGAGSDRVSSSRRPPRSCRAKSRQAPTQAVPANACAAQASPESV